MAPAPLIKAITVDGDRLQVRADDCFARDWLRDDFFAVYEGISLKKLDPTLLAVPFLLNVAPVVWISGSSYRIPELDATLADALERIKSAFAAMYPRTEWPGSIVVENRTSKSLETGEEVGVLFSGGVDSIHASLRNRAQAQTLITIWGADIPLKNREGWERVRGDAERFASEWGHETRFIRSNFRRLLDAPKLSALTPEIPEWFGYVQHGIGLSGMCLPLLAAEGIGTLLIAATHSRSFRTPWGSRPDLDEEVAWDGISVRHEGYDVTRQQKLQDLKALVDAHGPVSLRVCWRRQYGDGGNCGRCEKCLRTATGLMAEGESPREWGFDLRETTVTRRVRLGFGTLSFPMPDRHLYMWQDIQRRVRQTAQLPGRYGSWLTRFDFDAYKRRRAWRERLVAEVRPRLLDLPVVGPVYRRAAWMLQVRRGISPRAG